MRFRQLTLFALLGSGGCLSIKSYQGLGDMAAVEGMSEAVLEATRYIDAKGQPINLAQTQGHARLRLSQASTLDAEPKVCTKRDLDSAWGNCPVNKAGGPADLRLI